MSSIQLRGIALPLGQEIPLRSGFTEHVAPTAFADMLRLELPCSLLLGSHDGPLIASTDSATLELFSGPDALFFEATIFPDIEGFHSLHRYTQCSVNFVERETDQDDVVTQAAIDHIALVEDGCAYGNHVGTWVANKPTSSLRLQCFAQRWAEAYCNRAKASAPAPSTPKKRPTLQRTSLMGALPPLDRGWTLIGSSDRKRRT